MLGEEPVLNEAQVELVDVDALVGSSIPEQTSVVVAG